MSKPRLVIKPKALAVARLRLGLTPSEFATRVGYTPERIYQFESGSAIGIRPDRARRLAEVLGVDLSEITEIEGAEGAA